LDRVKNINSYFTNAVFNDFDQYAEVAKQWDVDFTQLEVGTLKAAMTIIGSEGFQAFRTSYSKSLLQKGSSPKTLITFAVPRRNRGTFFWRGKKISGNNIIIFPLYGELDSESKLGFDVFALSFSPEFIQQLCTQLNYPKLQHQIRVTEVVTVSELSMNMLRNFLENIFGNLPHQKNHLSDAKFIETIKYEILKQILSTIEKPLDASNESSIRLRDKAFTKAKTFILEHVKEPITVQKLVEETGVTDRTLEFAFLERFGITPKAALKSFRLNGVNGELKLATAGNSKVADIANHWGFWHMGQFAKDYKTMFGELPSETLLKG